MKRRSLSRYAKKRLTLASAILGAGLMLHSCGEAEAEPQPDPLVVERFLVELEATQGTVPAGARNDKEDGAEKRLINFVEDAAERAPTTATVNRIETVVAGRLG